MHLVEAERSKSMLAVSLSNVCFLRMIVKKEKMCLFTCRLPHPVVMTSPLVCTISFNP